MAGEGGHGRVGLEHVSRARLVQGGWRLARPARSGSLGRTTAGRAAPGALPPGVAPPAAGLAERRSFRRTSRRGVRWTVPRWHPAGWRPGGPVALPGRRMRFAGWRRPWPQHCNAGQGRHAPAAPQGAPWRAPRARLPRRRTGGPRRVLTARALRPARRQPGARAAPSAAPARTARRRQRRAPRRPGRWLHPPWRARPLRCLARAVGRLGQQGGGPHQRVGMTEGVIQEGRGLDLQGAVPALLLVLAVRVRRDRQASRLGAATQDGYPRDCNRP